MRVGEDRLAQHAGLDRLLQPHEVRLEPVLEKDTERDARLARRLDEGVRARGRNLDRFLDEHVQTRRGRRDPLRAVQARGAADGDEVERPAGEEGVEIGEGLRAVPRADRFHLLAVGALDGRDLDASGARGARVALGDAAASGKADAQRAAGHSAPPRREIVMGCSDD